MARTFKVLSVLLTYPDGEIQAAASAMREVVLAEDLVPKRVREPLLELVDQLGTRELYDLQERYVLLFDRTRSLSLHLFEHLHGESRDRGQAMVDLANLYEQHGLVVSASELHDYLPLFLEFLSTLPFEEARELLAQPLHIVSALGERLRRRESVYQWVFRGIEAVAEATPDSETLNEILEAPDDDPTDLEALDRVWEEEPVTFGPGTGGGCGRAQDMLRRMNTGNPPASAGSSRRG
ncbi:MAG: nitrate reductase molybdenum cofactor assembly chaperone [Rhodospirillaceae bacterium]|nr:nitrate reductase molybdenum cofactor assembly chaperone [Rhodospirillaceae bacterium]